MFEEFLWRPDRYSHPFNAPSVRWKSWRPTPAPRCPRSMTWLLNGQPNSGGSIPYSTIQADAAGSVPHSGITRKKSRSAALIWLSCWTH